MLAMFGLMALYLATPAGLLVWALWLRRRGRAPSRFPRWGLVLASASTLMFVLAPLAAGGMALGIFFSMDSRAGASQRPHPILEMMGSAMSVGAVVWGATVAATVLWLLYATTRWHWLSPGKAPETPAPYR